MGFKEFRSESLSLWNDNKFNLSQLYKELEKKFSSADPEVYNYIMGGKDFPSFNSFKSTLKENISQTHFTLEEGLLILYNYKKGRITDLIDPEEKKKLIKRKSDNQQLDEYDKEMTETKLKSKTSIIYTPMGNKIR